MPTGFDYNVDTLKLEELISELDKSRHDMYNAIVRLNTARKKLATGEAWSGEAANAALITFEEKLYKMLVEEKRLNSLAWQLGQYVNALKENERIAALEAANI